MIIWAAALAALFIGVILGLLGGGGSVLSVPVFVYLLGATAKSAVAMSMPVVGVTSVIGAWGHWRAGNVEWKSATTFGLVAMLGAFAGARAAHFLTGAQQLGLLAVVMAASAGSMLYRRPRTERQHDEPDAPAGAMLRPAVLGSAVGVGIMTGLVGIGGGFLIVPALTALGKVPIRRAIGTSLVVIAMNSASGMLGYVGQTHIDWRTVAWFTTLSSIGILAGSRFAHRVPASHLRRGFAFLLLALSAFLLWQNRAILLS